MAKHPAPLEVSELDMGGGKPPLTLRRNARARRMILRVDRHGTGVVLTVPMRTSRQRALEFARTHSQWIESRLAAASKRVVFAQGAVIPLRGKEYMITITGGVRGAVRVEPPSAEASGHIEVPGDSTHAARRLREWLKAECKKDLIAASAAHAKAMGVKFHKISVRDQSSRWGSCSASGQLSFSWRLILAPSFVLDYVAAHEVAHLAQMNHGPKFWALVARHCPDLEKARVWIRRHGRDLHSYDF